MIPAQRKKLRAQAHSLKPVVTIGQSGLTEAVIAELELALDHHELIKVKIRSDDRGLRKQIGDQLALQTQSDLIQRIGQVIVVYRCNPDK